MLLINAVSRITLVASIRAVPNNVFVKCSSNSSWSLKAFLDKNVGSLAGLTLPFVGQIFSNHALSMKSYRITFKLAEVSKITVTLWDSY